ncbi:molybdopterin-dependent oxidoreductase [Mucilaginibacter gossypiicola]|nr:molybdopterin-dependent oxidoreductase [Mucilaginibacter gossypiicola]
MKLTKKLSKVFSRNKAPKRELTVEQKISRRNFISFGSFLVLGGAAYGGWRWLYTSPNEVPGITGEAHKPLRAVLNANEKVVRQLYSNKNLVKTYPKEMAAKVVRHNSDIGSEGLIDIDAWKLSVKKHTGEMLNIGIDEIKKLPKTEIIYDFKCVEGWDQISHWGGVKFSDFIAHFKLDAETRFEYVGMETPDKEYYVGVDMPSAMHPQTLLAYEVNEKPLPPKHGAPLRLIIPVKYGIKNLKRIGSISFSSNRPPDYWAEQGYDYYAGL